MKVKELMARNIPVVSEDTSLREIGRVMVNKNSESVVITTPESRPIGIITRSDVVRYLVSEKGLDASLTAKEIVRDDLMTIGPEEELSRATEFMEERYVHHLVVVDENGIFVGVLTAIDLSDLDRKQYRIIPNLQTGTAIKQ